MATAPQNFWPYTLALYGKPGLAPALIGLQDRLGLDVNLLLYCCWVPARGRALEADDIAAADRAVALWRRDVIEPLRALRQRVKRGVEGIPTEIGETYRRKMIDMEVAGEEIAQGRLEALLPGRPLSGEPRIAAQRHLDLYLHHRGRTPAQADRAALGLLLDRAFAG